MNDESRQFEERLTAMQIDIAVIRSNYVTREDAQAIKGALEARLDAHGISLENLQKSQDHIWAAIEDLRHAIDKLRREQNALVWKIMGFVTILIGGVHILDRYGY